MALTATENAVAFKRVENLASSIQGIREECQRLKDFAAEFGGDLSATPEHTVAELVAFRDNVINPFLDFLQDGTVAQRDRVADLQEWLTLPQV